MRITCFIMSSLLLCFLAIVSTAQPAQTAQPLAEDPVVEERLNKLSKELRCLQCQNETLAESRAGLAEDLRREIRGQIRAGKTDDEIIAFLTQRYGDFILYRPPVRPTTYLLWFGPFVLLLLGLLILFQYVRRRRDLIPEEPLTKSEKRQAEELLRGKETA
jgi:cytochrome c-type biogenesis protein CcmH